MINMDQNKMIIQEICEKEAKKLKQELEERTGRILYGTNQKIQDEIIHAIVEGYNFLAYKLVWSYEDNKIKASTEIKMLHTEDETKKLEETMTVIDLRN